MTSEVIAEPPPAARRVRKEDRMPVTYVIGFRVRPGQRGRFLGLLEPVLDAMRLEPSFRSATLNADPADDQRFLLHETWESHEEVLAVQIHRPYRAAFHAALDELLAAPRDITVWTMLRSDHAA
jgi:quinol monooxygenase YgiN